MERELTDRWTKTRPSIAQLSALASCGHVLFLADFITSTFGSSFQYTHDHHVGQIVDTLKELGLNDSTRGLRF
jgi:hypothetical protein